MPTRTIYFFAVFISLFIFPNNWALSQTYYEIKITSQGEMDGHNGYYFIESYDGVFSDTAFEFVEGEYLRVYAVRNSRDTSYQILPDSCYVVNLFTLHIGDSWPSCVDESIIARVVDTATVEGYFSYIVNYIDSNGGIEIAFWFSSDLGIVRLFGGRYATIDSFSIVGGQGYFPLAVGNSWRYRISESNIENVRGLPEEIILSQNYPNLFNAQTTISYSVPNTGDVTIDIFDILGRKIETIAGGMMPAGEHQAIWDASSQASGIYFYRIKAGDKVETKRMLLLK